MAETPASPVAADRRDTTQPLVALPPIEAPVDASRVDEPAIAESEAAPSLPAAIDTPKGPEPERDITNGLGVTPSDSDLRWLPLESRPLAKVHYRLTNEALPRGLAQTTRAVAFFEQLTVDGKTPADLEAAWRKVLAGREAN